MTSSPRPGILVVTTKIDITADYVILALREREAHFYRLNTEDLPLEARSRFMVGAKSRSSTWEWTDATGNCVDLSGVRSVWYRRHRLPELSQELDSDLEDFCLRECQWFLRGALLARDVSWMSHPTAVSAAEAKPHQLAIASRIGFRVPHTLITNDALAARDFHRRHRGRVVAKACRMGYIRRPTGNYSIYTTPVSQTDLQDEGAIHLAPVIFQEHVDKACDLRVTVVGGTVFAARIDSQSLPSAMTDWRRTESADLPHSRCDLPPQIATKCRKLLTALGLNFGAIDLVLDKTGSYYFLEINPSGQWAWIQDRLGFDISGAIADWLVDAEGDRRGAA